MILSILFACSILAVSILGWLLRRRFTKCLPSKETMSTLCLIAPVALLLVLAILPDLVLLFTTINLTPPILKTILAVAAATMVCVGCSKQTDPSKPRRLHWSAAETGFESETLLPPDPKPKEAQ